MPDEARRPKTDDDVKPVTPAKKNKKKGKSHVRPGYVNEGRRKSLAGLLARHDAGN